MEESKIHEAIDAKFDDARSLRLQKKTDRINSSQPDGSMRSSTFSREHESKQSDTPIPRNAASALHYTPVLSKQQRDIINVIDEDIPTPLAHHLGSKTPISTKGKSKLELPVQSQNLLKFFSPDAAQRASSVLSQALPQQPSPAVATFPPKYTDLQIQAQIFQIREKQIRDEVLLEKQLIQADGAICIN